MAELLHISHPFLSAEDFSRRVGSKSARQIRRLRRKYPQLTVGCGTGGMLLALSVAWGMTEAARNGDHGMIQHIDAALTPYRRMGYIVEPPGGCIVVGERPYYFVEGEHAGGSPEPDSDCAPTGGELAVQTADFCPLEPSPAILRELSTEKAQKVMEGLQDLGVLDAHLQPVNLSWSERGYLAQQIAYKLGIEHQWKTFGELWHCDAVSLRSGYNRAKEMPKMADFEEKIKEIVG